MRTLLNVRVFKEESKAKIPFFVPKPQLYWEWFFKTYRDSLPIRYVTREEFERMSGLNVGNLARKAAAV